MKSSNLARQLMNHVINSFVGRSPNASRSITFGRHEPRIVVAFAAKLLRNRGFEAEAGRGSSRCTSLNVRRA